MPHTYAGLLHAGPLEVATSSRLLLQSPVLLVLSLNDTFLEEHLATQN